MDTDKRPSYIWFFAILANFGTYLAIVRESIGNGSFGANTILSSVTNNESLALIGISLFISIIPTLLSGLDFKWRSHLGYGIPILVILYSVWHYYTCLGKFCNLIDIPIGFWGLIFALFYALGTYLRKWNKKVVLSLLWIEVILLVGTIVFIGYQSHLNAVSSAKLSSLQEESQKATSPVEIGRTCDSIPDDPHNGFLDACWQRAMAMYPNIDVCSWSREANSKNKCLFYQGLRYSENREYGCEDKDSQTSYSKKDDSAENSRLLQCWSEKAKIYPELNICQWTYEWNRDRCTSFLKTISR